MRGAGMSEWPLIVFTLAIQFAGGLALAATLCDRQGQPDHFMRPLGISIFPIALFGLLASLWHLGRPFSAWRSLFNLDSSRLSLEVLLTLLFVTAALAYSYAWWAQKTEYRFVLGVVTSLLALGAIASSAAIYLIPAQPVWNSAWVPLSFLGTALLLAGSASAAWLYRQGLMRLPGSLRAGTILGSLLLIVAAVWMVVILSRGSADEFAAGQLQSALFLLTARYPVWMALHLLLAGILPLAFAVLLWSGKHTPWTHAFVFLAGLAGAAIGRRLMYLIVASLPQF